MTDSPAQPRWQAPASVSRATSGVVRSNVVMSREKRGGVGEQDGSKRNSGVHAGVDVEGALSGSAPLQSGSPQTHLQLEQALRVAHTMHRRSRSAGSMKVRRFLLASPFSFSRHRR